MVPAHNFLNSNNEYCAFSLDVLISNLLEVLANGVVDMSLV